MSWTVEYTDEFATWWEGLSNKAQDDIVVSVSLLEIFGPALKYPYCSKVRGAKHRHMRELRIQHQGMPYRILYAFNSYRTAILLIGGNKKGNKHWYTQYIALADKLFDDYLQELCKEEK